MFYMSYFTGTINKTIYTNQSITISTTYRNFILKLYLGHILRYAEL